MDFGIKIASGDGIAGESVPLDYKSVTPSLIPVCLMSALPPAPPPWPLLQSCLPALGASLPEVSGHWSSTSAVGSEGRPGLQWVGGSRQKCGREEQGGLRPIEAGDGGGGSWRVRQGSGGGGRGLGRKVLSWKKALGLCTGHRKEPREKAATLLVWDPCSGAGRKAPGRRSERTGSPEILGPSRSTCECDRSGEGGGARV